MCPKPTPGKDSFYSESGPRNQIERDAVYFRCKSFKPDTWDEKTDGNYTSITFEYFGGDQGMQSLFKTRKKCQKEYSDSYDRDIESPGFF